MSDAITGITDYSHPEVNQWGRVWREQLVTTWNKTRSANPQLSYLRSVVSLTKLHYTNDHRLPTPQLPF